MGKATRGGFATLLVRPAVNPQSARAGAATWFSSSATLPATPAECLASRIRALTKRIHKRPASRKLK